MEISEKGAKTGSIAVTPPAKSSKPFRKRVSKAPVMDGDQVIRVVVTQLMEAGYPIEAANFEGQDGVTVACLKLTGKVWTDDGRLVPMEKVKP